MRFFFFFLTGMGLGGIGGWGTASALHKRLRADEPNWIVVSLLPLSLGDS